ncbi:MAG: DUF4397 domain-containing protein [Fimbriimonadaceae bacterium]|nr:DUF4397 domain-containing protein [Fimbriimonadaceae bacterium]
MRRRAVCLLLAGLGLAGCGGPVGLAAAQVVFANLLAGGAALSVARQGQPLENLGTGGLLANGAASVVLTVNPGEAMYRGQGASGERYFETALDLPAGTLTHGLLIGEVGGGSAPAPRLLVYRVTDEVPPGRYGLRFIHAAPRLGAVDFGFVETAASRRLTELAQGSALNFGVVTGLVDGVAAPNLASLPDGEIVVRAAGTADELLRRPVTLTVNATATFALTGSNGALGLVRW